MRKLFRQPIAVVSFVVICSYIVLAVLCGFNVAFPSFELVDNANAYLPPDSLHWLGTDIFGRDVLARAAHGVTTSLIVGFFGSGLAVVIGTALGAIAGYAGGKIDELTVWFYTTIDTIPYILLVVAFSFVAGSGLRTLCLAIGLTSWVSPCRILRAVFMKHREK
jgi:peptide/nickel transport system permease protein